MIGSIVVVICLSFNAVFAQFEGDTCRVQVTGEKGRCILLDDCDYAKNLLKLRQKPQHCGFKGSIPIVCCPLTEESIPGQKSQKQCEYYYNQIPDAKFIFKGEKSLAMEFPHMAVLGYGDKNDIQWLCGGSLISDQFVLTAAHCLLSRDLGIVKWARLGDLDIKNNSDDARPQDFDIVSTAVHPKYRPYSHYHDIATLKLDKKVIFTFYVQPICLYPKDDFPRELMATGWGKTDFLGEPSSHLMKVKLNYIGYNDCNQRFFGVSRRKLENGIVDSFQVCAGHPSGGDTCPGDSGGPLQFKILGMRYYSIVGVTSFGKACGGSEDSIGVYTRVAQYIDWIEDTVWPSD